MQHERKPRVRIVHSYDADTLGAPFKVTLLDSVTFGLDPKTGQETVQIPDLVGLINAVVRARVRHTHKLSGAEVKFIRNALGIQANKLATFLGMSPEHFSRCESGAKAMSVSNEKILRLFSFLATFFEEPEDLLMESMETSDITNKSTKPSEMVDRFFRMFLSMKIEAVVDSADELHFEFVRRERFVGETVPCEIQDDGEWTDSEEPIAA